MYQIGFTNHSEVMHKISLRNIVQNCMSYVNEWLNNVLICLIILNHCQDLYCTGLTNKHCLWTRGAENSRKRLVSTNRRLNVIVFEEPQAIQEWIGK